MRQLIWIAFDLGVRGDFEGMYAFLDAHGAKECGDGIGVFSYEYKRDLIQELTRELTKSVQMDKRSRVYAIFPGAGATYRGRFIVGKRKPSPWAGYGSSEVDEEDVAGSGGVSG